MPFPIRAGKYILTTCPPTLSEVKIDVHLSISEKYIMDYLAMNRELREFRRGALNKSHHDGVVTCENNIL